MRHHYRAFARHFSRGRLLTLAAATLAIQFLAVGLSAAGWPSGAVFATFGLSVLLVFLTVVDGIGAVVLEFKRGARNIKGPWIALGVTLVVWALIAGSFVASDRFSNGDLEIWPLSWAWFAKITDAMSGNYDFANGYTAEPLLDSQVLSILSRIVAVLLEALTLALIALIITRRDDRLSVLETTTEVGERLAGDPHPSEVPNQQPPTQTRDSEEAAAKENTSAEYCKEMPTRASQRGISRPSSPQWLCPLQAIVVFWFLARRCKR